jgi:uncharacterized repeat protein (TIGR03803 family)
MDGKSRRFGPPHPRAATTHGSLVLFNTIAVLLSLAFSQQANAGLVREICGFVGNSQPSALIQGFDGAFYGVTGSQGALGYGSVFRVATNGLLSTLVSFAFTNGANPDTPLVQGPDGAFYGTTPKGGAKSNGTIFRFGTNGILTTFSFTGTNAPYYGRYPRALCLHSDGALYGTTYYGGLDDAGVVFRITTNGAFSVISSFSKVGEDAGLSEGLCSGPDGSLYGSASASGPQGYGTVFKVDLNGGWNTVASFNETNGFQPSSRIMFGTDGYIYGTTYFGGRHGNGTVFRCSINGFLTNMTDFAGETSQSCLLESGGLLYGTTRGGFGNSRVFSMSPSGTTSTVFSFNGADGYGLCDELALGADGALYGTTFGGGLSDSGTVFRLTASGLHSNFYSFPPSYGSSPYGNLVLTPGGEFYGTTSSGGASNLGTIFKVNSQGELTQLASFTRSNGEQPEYGLLRGTDGSFYGTTLKGGSSGLGVLFHLGTNGELSALSSFDFSVGYYPRGLLVQASDGAFYGTTVSGGTNFQGAVFKATTNGALSLLASFNGTLGATPLAGLTFGRDGALYGTTSQGGSMNGGTVFRVTTNGLLSSVASFDPVSGKGSYSRAPLLLGTDGAFYGTTYYSSTNNGGYGTVFRVTSNSTLTTLAVFTGNPQPAYPHGALLQGSDGALYGTTISGGTGFGTIYRLTTNGDLTVLVAFDRATGSGPQSGLIQAADGFFYGTSPNGGSQGRGNVFCVPLISKMHPPLRAGAGFSIDFDGIRGNTYRLQRATNLLGPWATIAFSSVGPDGVGHSADPGPLPQSAFYRSVYP